MSSFKLTVMFKIPAKRLYTAWLDSKIHSMMIGASAKISAKVGGKFNVWDGYIIGKNLILVPGLRIVQSWRTTEFPPESPDSNLELIFTETSKGTKLTLIHSNLPEEQVKELKQGWKEYYFTPMQTYFR